MTPKNKHPLGVYLNISIWLVAAALLALSLRTLAFADASPPIPPGDFATRPTADTSAAAKPSRVTVRLYDVRDIVDRWASPASEVPDDTGLNSTSNNQRKNPQGGGGIFSTTEPAAVADPVMQSMVEIISNGVQSRIWTANGGTGACIGYGSRTLVVTGDAAVHRDVQRLLRDLRDADANTPMHVQH